MDKKVAIHQPNYMPWLGFFLKMNLADVIILHDNVQYTKNGPTRRCMIRKDRSSSITDWLTIPLVKHSDYDLVLDLKIDDTQKWQRKHLNKFFYLYRDAPYFNDVFPLLENWLTNYTETKSLSKFNSMIIKEICNNLDIKKPIYHSSDLPLAIMQSNDYNLSIVQFVNGTHYIRGSGAASYQNDNLFIYNQVQLLKCDFLSFITTHPYVQSDQPFLPGLTITDALMYLGIQGTKEYIQNFKLNF